MLVQCLPSWLRYGIGLYPEAVVCCYKQGPYHPTSGAKVQLFFEIYKFWGI